MVVWQKSMFLVKEIYLLSAKLPVDEKFGLKSQMQRSTVSIPSNIAEGWGRGYNQSFVHFLNICMEIGKMLYLLKNNIKSKTEISSN